jgi:hypothetical protein
MSAHLGISWAIVAERGIPFLFAAGLFLYWRRFRRDGPRG